MDITGGELELYIIKDLQHRIESGINISAPLTLKGLAEEYGTSVTPVRAALMQLEATGFIIKENNRRLSINTAKIKVGNRTNRVTPPATPADWDQILIQDVMRASLKKNATYLREITLADRHHTGRSIIRHALTRLAGTGLIEHVPRCGWRVHPLRERDLLAYLEIRELLELKALELARQKLCSDDLKQMLEENPIPRPHTPVKINNDLHHYIIQKSGNRYIHEFFNKPVAQYYTALFDYATPKTSVSADQACRHRKILNALLAKNWEIARKELSAHIQSQANVLRTLLT